MPKKAEPKPKLRRRKEDVVPAIMEGACGLIADVALIPPETRRWFVEAIQSTIWEAIEADGILNRRDTLLSRKAHHRQSLRRIEKAAKELAKAIEQSTDGAEVCLWQAFFRRRSFPGCKVPTEQIAQEYWSLIEAIETVPTIASDAVGLVNFDTSRLWHLQSKRVSPRKEAGQKLAGFFILWAAKGGGRWTLDKTTGRGTLIEALKYCKPFLPDGFQIPSPATLHTIKKQLEKELASASWWKLSPADRIG